MTSSKVEDVIKICFDLERNFINRVKKQRQCHSFETFWKEWMSFGYNKDNARVMNYLDGRLLQHSLRSVQPLKNLFGTTSNFGVLLFPISENFLLIRIYVLWPLWNIFSIFEEKVSWKFKQAITYFYENPPCAFKKNFMEIVTCALRKLLSYVIGFDVKFVDDNLAFSCQKP